MLMHYYLFMRYRYVMDHIQSEGGRRVAQLMHHHHAGRQVAGSGWSVDSLSDTSVVRRRASRGSTLMDQLWGI